MDRDTNYVVVGAFVLLVIAMAVSFVFWYTDQRDKRTYQRYEIYFQGSVSGLTAGSPVRYLGVDVGKVVRITLEPQLRKRVQVIADIEAAAPIDGRTLASLTLQGVTGLLFIDLEEDPKANGPGVLAHGHRYPVIRSAPSDFDVLLSNLPALAARASELVDHLDQVFSDENVTAFKATINGVRRASERLPETVQDMKQLMTDMRSASHEVQSAAAELRSVTTSAAPDIKIAIAKMRDTTENLASASAHLDRFVTENEPTLSQFTTEGLPQFEQLLREAQDASRDLSDLSRSLRQNPSQLLYESNYHGVELPR
jgi:phospholipid/cholesterol/gamma-HCH transport system substrate-binding protein